jgi:hypothetical protein
MVQAIAEQKPNKGTRTNVRAHGSTRVDSDQHSTLKHKAKSGGTMIEFDLRMARVMVIL